MFNTTVQYSMKFGSRVNFSVISILLFISFSICNVNLMAQGNLQIAPHRVVFEGSKKIIDVNLVNTGQDSANYSISFLQYRMSEESSVEEITTPDPGQRFADKNIRFFPRSVLLGPGESQIVKLQLIKSEQLEPGEYRSHLYFRSLPTQKALGEEEPKKDTSNISIKITPIFGITIPVIIRVGESTTILNMTDLKLEKAADGTNKLNLTIHRIGNMSVIGDILMTYIAPNGKETKIGLANGIVVYTPNALRRLKLDVENKSAVDLSKGSIHVTFLSQSYTHPVKLAEADLVL